MLFSCLPEGARIPGRFPGPPHPRGKHFTVDIHCHVLTEQAETMFREAGLVERIGHDVHVVAGSDRNLKITRPGDMQLAEFYLREERAAR